MKKLVFVLLSLVSFALVHLATAQNRLYVRVEQNSMALLGYGGSTFLYDHIFLLPDGTAVRFDDTNTDDGIDVLLPSNINLATATESELVSAGGTQGTYQDQGGTIQTSFGMSFVSSGEKYSGDADENGYMLITTLPATLITGQYRNSSTAMMGSTEGGLATQVMAGSSSTYDFYPDGSFGNAESSAVGSTSNNSDGNFGTGVTSSNEGGSAGTYVFEGYNVFLTLSDGSQSIFPAYLWPSYQPLEDQILMIDGSEYLTQDDSTIPFTQVPANSSAPAPGNNPAGGQNPLAQPQAETANPLAQPTEAAQNPLQTPEPSTPSTASPNTLSGTVTAPEGVTLSSAYVIVCPTDLEDTNDCLTAPVEATGSYNLQIPGPGEYIVMAAMDADGNGELNTGDYTAQDSFDTPGDEAQAVDFVLEPYSE
jgi:hypothetical protein